MSSFISFLSCFHVVCLCVSSCSALIAGSKKSFLSVEEILTPYSFVVAGTWEHSSSPWRFGALRCKTPI